MPSSSPPLRHAPFAIRYTDANGTHVLNAAVPLTNVRTWVEPGPASVVSRTPGGKTTAWVRNVDALLEGTTGPIPGVSRNWSAYPGLIVAGWDDAWQPFLTYARDGGEWVWCPDARQGTTGAVPCVLEAPLGGNPAVEWTQTRALTLRMRRLDGLLWTSY